MLGRLPDVPRQTGGDSLLYGDKGTYEGSGLLAGGSSETRTCLLKTLSLDSDRL